MLVPGVVASSINKFVPPTGFRYWGLHMVAGGSLSQNRMVGFYLSTTPGSPSSQILTSSGQFGWSISTPSSFTNTPANLLNHNDGNFYGWAKAGGARILHADLGSEIAVESMSIRFSSSAYQPSEIRVYATNSLSDVLDDWTPMSEAISVSGTSWSTGLNLVYEK